jgi:predicted aminopeptidase
VGVGITALAAVVATCALTGCANLGYYWQQTRGHFSMLGAAKPVDAWLADAAVEPRLRERLLQLKRIRQFAIAELKLPDNDSYTKYADLKRPFVVWNIVATPELSLTPKTWCFPVAGCVSYRGYFDKAEAEALAAQLTAEGMDVNLYGVAAYSTLGWFADPVLNTFIHYPEGELARIIFHELAHQVAYAKDDSAWNEGFASAVEQLGVERYLQAHGNDKNRADYALFDARRQDFRALLNRANKSLVLSLSSQESTIEKRAKKAQVFKTLRSEYTELKASGAAHWRGYAGYDGFFNKELNNAHLAGVATYTALVPTFERLHAQAGADFAAFYTEVKRLSALSKTEREAQLQLVK